jgi:hypothetical protein
MNRGFMYLIELVGGPDDGLQLKVPQLFDTWDMIQEGKIGLLLEHDDRAGIDRYYLTTKVSKEGATLYYHEGLSGEGSIA